VRFYLKVAARERVEMVREQALVKALLDAS
jgi:hypothetical protein